MLEHLTIGDVAAVAIALATVGLPAFGLLVRLVWKESRRDALLSKLNRGVRRVCRRLDQHDQDIARINAHLKLNRDGSGEIK